MRTCCNLHVVWSRNAIDATAYYTHIYIYIYRAHLVDMGKKKNEDADKEHAKLESKSVQLEYLHRQVFACHCALLDNPLAHLSRC